MNEAAKGELTIWQRWRRAALVTLGLYCWLLASLLAYTFHAQPPRVRYLTPEHAQLALAKELYKAKGFDAASRLFESVYRSRPDSPLAIEAMHQDALICAMRGETDRAAHLMRRAAVRSPMRSPWRTIRWVMSGAFLLRGGRGDQAVELYREVLAEEPRLPARPVLVVELMGAMTASGRPQEVQGVFDAHRDEIEGSKSAGWAYLELAKAREAMGDRVGAHGMYAKAARTAEDEDRVKAARRGMERTSDGK